MSLSSMKDEIGAAVRGGVSQLGESVTNELANEISKGTERVTQDIQARIKRITQVVSSTPIDHGSTRGGLNEEAIMKILPDERNLAGVGFLLVALLAFMMQFWVAGAAFFLIGLVRFAMGPLWAWKIDVPNGFQGVRCLNGKPSGLANQARNWNFNIFSHIHALVSTHDFPIEIQTAGYTKDFATLSRSDQYVLRVDDPATFIEHASPATVAKLVRCHGRMTMLRMIASVGDSRVKFVRGKLPNVANEINRLLLASTGVRVHECTPSNVTNPILDDFEHVRTEIEMIRKMRDEYRAKRENAEKTVEQRRRGDEREAVKAAIELQQAYGNLKTAIVQRTNAKRQGIAMRARQELDQAVSALLAKAASVRAKIRKAITVAESVQGIKTNLEIRKARIMRGAFAHMTPRRIDIFDVPGIGSGIGMSLGNELVGRIINHEKPALALVPNEEAQAASSS